MAKTIPLARATNEGRARRAKTMLLPMPRAMADDLALRVHLALAAMSRGAGTRQDAQTLTQTMLLTGFLSEAGQGHLPSDQFAAADAAISASFDHGRATGEWRLDEAAAALFATLVTAYDEQLRRAPLWAIIEVSDQLDRFQAGEPYQRTNRKQA
jgi:hypothetical protein